MNAATAARKCASISLFVMRYAKSSGAASVACGVLYVLRPLEIGTPASRLFIVAVTSLAAHAGHR